MTPELAARTYALPASDPVRAKLESPFFGRILPRLLREAGGGRVLDLGCGDCQAASLAGPGLSGYLGVDLRVPDAGCGEEVVVHDLRAGLGPVGSEPFDLYLATFGVASHLDPGELGQLVSEVAEHARSGALVAFEALGLYSLEWPRLWNTPPGPDRLLDYRLGADVSVHPWGPDELVHLFEDAGLRPLRALDRSLQTGPKLGDGRYWPGLPPLREAIGRLLGGDESSNPLEALTAPLPPLPAGAAARVHHELADRRREFVPHLHGGPACLARAVWGLEGRSGGGFGHGLTMVARVP
jgi:SAM-dependent methyltransferase